jgi:hypothetical protein
MVERAAQSDSDQTGCDRLLLYLFLLKCVRSVSDWRRGMLKLFVRQTWKLRNDASVSRNFVMCKLYLPFCHVLFLHILQRLQDETYIVSGLILRMPYLPVPYFSTGILAPQIVP